MADDHSDRDKKLKLITDPEEIKDILGKQDAHEKALEEAGKKKKHARFLAKIASKMESGQTFNITWNKIEGTEDVGSSLLTGHVMRSRDKDGEHFTLSVAVDYAKLYALNPDKQNVSAANIEFNQHRATQFSAGTYDSMMEAKTAIQRMDQYLMHVLAESGAENTMLVLENGRVVIKDDKEHTADQSYSDALRTARLVEIFRANIIDNNKPDFKQLIGNILGALIEETGLECDRREKDDQGLTTVRLIFDRDIGEFSFQEMPRGAPPKLTHEIRTSHGANTKREKFSGDLTSVSLQDHFISWIAAAAHERETIPEEVFETLNENISAIQGVSLKESKLGLLSPYDEGKRSRSNFRPN